MDDSPTARSRELGALLRETRAAAGWPSSNRLAKDIGWSQAKASRLETGMRPASPVDVAFLAGFCRITREQRDVILELAEGGRDGCWVRPHHGVLPEAVPSVVFQQNTASEITWYEPAGLPAVLQSGEYQELELLPRFPTTEEAMPHLKARCDRHAWLCARDRPESVFYLPEATLRHMPVPDEAKVGQLLYLAMLIGQGKFRVRIIPADLERTRFAVSGFQLMRFAEFPPVVCVPGDLATLIFEGRKHINAYQAIVDELNKAALSEQDSADLITTLATHGASGESADAPPDTAWPSIADSADAT